tara:strand:+ start:46 stop:1578 length:1533 start_codon:yes stop_codon:yes gene_type:complete
MSTIAKFKKLSVDERVEHCRQLLGSVRLQKNDEDIKNPLTNRAIKMNGATYNVLTDLCGPYNVNPNEPAKNNISPIIEMAKRERPATGRQPPSSKRRPGEPKQQESDRIIAELRESLEEALLDSAKRLEPSQGSAHCGESAHGGGEPDGCDRGRIVQEARVANQTVATRVQNMQEMQNTPNSAPPQKSACSQAHASELFSDHAYCDWDKYYTLGLALMSGLRASIVAAVIASVGSREELIGGLRDFNIVQVLNGATSNLKFKSLGLLMANWNVPGVTGIMSVINSISECSQSFMQSGLHVWPTITHFLTKLGTSAATSKTLIDSVSFYQFGAFIVRMLTGVIRCVTGSLGPVNLVEALLALNSDGTLYIAHYLRRTIKYKDCNKYYPAKMHCQRNDIITVLSQDWEKKEMSDYNPEYLVVTKWTRHGLDIQPEMQGKELVLEAGDVLQVQHEPYKADIVQEVPLKFRQTKSRTLVPGVALKIGNTLYVHKIFMEFAPNCKDTDPSGCVPE